jgi:hypothetical protein
MSPPVSLTSAPRVVTYPLAERTVMDIAYLVGTLAFFGLTWGFVKLCERV